MTKFAVLFFATLAFHASLAIPRYFEDDRLVKYLDDIKIEVRDLNLYFEKDFPEHTLAIKTVTWECNKLIEVVENIIKKLREETIIVRHDSRLFNDVVYVLDEIVEVLKRVTVYRDVTNVHELKKVFVVSINTILERLEKLVTLTYTSCPEFRFTLKYLLVDVMTALHGIRSHFMHINQGFEVVHAPRYLIKEIHDYTRVFTDILKDFNHRTQVKVALRGYLMYVREIVRVLEENSVLGNKEIDMVLVNLTDKLRKIVFNLMEIMEHRIVDVTVIKTEIITQIFDVVHILEQLVQLCEDKVLPESLTLRLVRIIYHYFYAVKHACYEIKMGHKIGFFMDKFYDMDFYTKYGFGSYEKNMLLNKWNKDMLFTPYMHTTLFPGNMYNMNHYHRNLNWNNNRMIDLNMKGLKYDNGLLYGNNLDMSILGQRNNRRVLYDDSLLMGNSLNWNMNLGQETRMDLVKTVEVLLKRVRDVFMYNTVEVQDMRHTLIYRIRELIDTLDWILVKCEMKVNEDRIVVDLIHKIKKIKMELRNIVSMGVFTDMREIKMIVIRSIEEVGMVLIRYIDMMDVTDLLVKDICYKFITFLRKITDDTMTLTHDITGNIYNRDLTYGRTMPMVYNRWMNYLRY